MVKFSSKDICAIIETCGKAGVKRFTIGDLDIDFSGNVGQPSQGYIPTGPWGPQVATNIDSAPTEIGQKEETQAFALQSRAVLEHAEEANLFLDDPSAWERQHIDQIMERDRLADG